MWRSPETESSSVPGRSLSCIWFIIFLHLLSQLVRGGKARSCRLLQWALTWRDTGIEAPLLLQRANPWLWETPKLSIQPHDWKFPNWWLSSAFSRPQLIGVFRPITSDLTSSSASAWLIFMHDYRFCQIMSNWNIIKWRSPRYLEDKFPYSVPGKSGNVILICYCAYKICTLWRLNRLTWQQHRLWIITSRWLQ